MGGGESHELRVPSRAGEDFGVRWHSCQRSANLEKAFSKASEPKQPDVEGDHAPEAFHTPGQKTIADLSTFTGLPETSLIKSVVMVAGEKPILVLLRGDHQLSETKLQSELGALDLRPAHPEELP